MAVINIQSENIYSETVKGPVLKESYYRQQGNLSVMQTGDN